jgi:hypothetical protein
VEVSAPCREDAVLLFVGGPLDGRMEIREARHGAPLPTVTHVHLHGGPKVVHRYDLESRAGEACVYRLRPRPGTGGTGAAAVDGGAAATGADVP